MNKIRRILKYIAIAVGYIAIAVAALAAYVSSSLIYWG